MQVGASKCSILCNPGKCFLKGMESRETMFSFILKFHLFIHAYIHSFIHSLTLRCLKYIPWHFRGHCGLYRYILIPPCDIWPLLASPAPLSAACAHSTLHRIYNSTCQAWHNCVFACLHHMTLSAELSEGRGRALCIVETPGPSALPKHKRTSV